MHFPPISFPDWIILIGLIACAVMYVLLPVAIPTVYGVRGVVRFVRAKLAARRDPERGEVPAR
jgi:hypothetical protein